MIEDNDVKSQSYLNTKDLGNKTSTDESAKRIRKKSYRVGKTFRGFKKNDQSEEGNVETTTSIYQNIPPPQAETPTIKITILPQDGEDERSNDARNLRYFSRFNRTKTTTKLNTETMNESIHFKNNKNMKISLGLPPPLKSRVTTPSSIETSTENSVISEDATTRHELNLSRLKSTTSKVIGSIKEDSYELKDSEENFETSTQRNYNSVRHLPTKRTSTVEDILTESKTPENVTKRLNGVIDRSMVHKIGNFKEEKTTSIAEKLTVIDKIFGNTTKTIAILNDSNLKETSTLPPSVDELTENTVIAVGGPTKDSISDRDDDEITTETETFLEATPQPINEKITHPKILIHEKLRAASSATPTSSEEVETSSAKIISTTPVTRKQLHLRRRPTTLAPKTELDEKIPTEKTESTSRRNLLLLNSNSFRTKNEKSHSLESESDNDFDRNIEMTTENGVVAQLNRHRPLFGSALENSTTKTQTFARPNHLRTKTEISQERPHRIKATTESSIEIKQTRVTASRNNVASINRTLYNRDKNSGEKNQDTDYDDEKQYEDSEDENEQERILEKPLFFPRTLQAKNTQRFQPNLQNRRPLVPNGQKTENNDRLNFEDNDDDSYEYGDISEEELKTSTTVRSIALEKLHNPVRVSQNRTESGGNSVIDYRLKDPPTNKRTSRIEHIPTSDNNDNEEASDDNEINTTVDSNSNNLKLLTNNAMSNLHKNPRNTNRSSTVANYFSRTKTNSNLSSNKILSTIGTVGSNVVNNNKIQSDSEDIEGDSQESKLEDDFYTKAKGTDVNSNRRFQKFQFNRTRNNPSAALNNDRKKSGVADQVNQLIDEKDDEDNGKKKEDEEEVEAGEVTESTPNLTSTPIPIRILTNRQPLGDLNSTAIHNQITLIQYSDTNDNLQTSVTNDTNTDTVTSSLDTENSIDDTNKTESLPQNPDTVPTKRFRKVIRKIIRPVITTTESNIFDTTETTSETVNSSTTSPETVQLTSRRRLNNTRLGLNRSINTKRSKIQQIDIEGEGKVDKEENGTFSARKSRLNLRNSRVSTEKPTAKTPNFNSAIRSRFGTRGSVSTTETAINEDDEEEESESNDNVKDRDETNKKNQSTNRFVASRRPFSPKNSIFTTERSLNVDEDNSAVTTLRAIDDGIDDKRDEDSAKDNSEKSTDFQKLREKVKIEQVSGDKENGVTSTRLKKIIVVRRNGTSATRTEISAADLIKINAEQEEDALQNLRNKVKQDQSKGDQDLGVVNFRLKKILEQRSKESNSTIPYKVAEKDDDSKSNGKENSDLQKIRDKIKVEQTRGDEDKGVISTRLKQVLAIKTNSTIESISAEETIKPDEENSSNSQPRPFSARKPFIPGFKNATRNESSTADNTTESTTRATPLRPIFRKKLIAKRPHVPINSNTTTTATPTVSTRPTRTYLKHKNASGRFAPFNAGNQNNGEGSGFKSKGRDQNLGSQEVSGDYEYDNEEETETDTKPSTPITPVVSIRQSFKPPGLFKRPISTVLKKPSGAANIENSDLDKGNDEEEDDDEEDDGESEEDTSEEADDQDNEAEVKTKFNSLSTFRPKGNRIVPGARPALPPSGNGNVPYNSRNRSQANVPNRLNAGGFTGRYGTPQFGIKGTTLRPRIANRPPGVAAPGLTIRPVAVSFERTTPILPTKPAPFISSNTRSYERKYVGSSTETPDINIDNSLIEDFNIEALNARNKKIFDINSKKHTTLKPKILIPTPLSPTDEQSDSQHTSQNTENENDDEYTATNAVGDQPGFATTTTPRTLTNTDDLNVNYNIISSQDNDGVTQFGASTQQTPTTTLLHIFTLTDDAQTDRPATDKGSRLAPRIIAERVRPKHKVVEVNRIVEINSKEDKLRRKSKANKEFLKPIGTSQLKVESLPHVEQLGEISVVKYVHLVDGSDISIDGHSTVADYTPTDPTIPRSSAPVRNIIPGDSMREYTQLGEGPHYVATTEGANLPSTLQERYGKALIPEVIREAAETSTISLEGLFDNARKSKELNTIDENAYFSYGLSTDSSTINPVYVPQTSEYSKAIESSKEGPTTIAPEIITLTHTESKHEATISPAEEASQTEVGNTTPSTENPTKATTVAVALFPTYVRPIVPLLRPESNESSPLVISIANLDKVILSKVERAQIDAKNKGNIENPQPTTTATPSSTPTPTQNEPQVTVTQIADSNSAFSNRHASIVEAPKKLIIDLDQNKPAEKEKNEGHTKLVSVIVGSTSNANAANSVSDHETHTNTNLITSSVSVSTVNNASNGSDVSSNSSSITSMSGNVSEVVSYRMETHVVRKKKSRSRKSKSRTAKKVNNTAAIPATVPEISTISATTPTTSTKPTIATTAEKTN